MGCPDEGINTLVHIIPEIIFIIVVPMTICVAKNCHDLQVVGCIKNLDIGFSQNSSKSCAFRNS